MPIMLPPPRSSTPTPYAKVVTVAAKSDLPSPVGGVITLAAGYNYHFTQAVDLTGDRLVCAGTVAITGTSSETASLSSTGLVGTALITSSYTLPMQNISITADVAVGLDGGGAAALDWKAVNFVDCPTVGTIANFANFIMESSAFLNSAGLTFDGTGATVAFETTLFEARAGGTLLTVAATASISRRLRITYSSFVVLAGETGIAVPDPTAFSNNETYILDTVNFAGGGTYLSGADETDAETLFSGCVGIANSTSVAHYYMTGNATSTAIAVPGTAVKAAGTTASGPNVQEFTQTSNRATYNGNLTVFYQVSVTASLVSSNNKQLSVYVAKNGVVDVSSQMGATSNAGGRVESTSTLSVLQLAPTDYFEVWVANDTNTANITVENLQVVAKRIQ